jgi:hypothetical protein
MHYECEGCGRELREESYLRYVHFEPSPGSKSTLIFCPGSFYGKEQKSWCLENTLYAMCLATEAIDADKLNLRMLVTTETEVHDPIGGRYPRTTGKYSSLFDLKRALESRINLSYERKDLNEANGKRLAEGDYLIPSPWLNEEAHGRAIKEIKT